MLRALPLLLALALLPSAAGSADAGRKTAPRCTPADIRDVVLDQATQIDGVRVVVARRSPIGGQVAVRVADGQSDRIVRIRGSLSRVLEFRPALSASQFQVSLDPIFEAARGACVERIELLRGGQPVATVRP
jgi:hypothetical protein